MSMMSCANKQKTYLGVGNVLELSHIWICVIQISNEGTCPRFNSQVGSCIELLAVLRSTKTEQGSDNEALEENHAEAAVKMMLS